MDKLLEAIHKRPGMYFGNSSYPFTSLDSFLASYQVGFAAAKNAQAKPEELVPDNFHKFVTERFGQRFPAGGKGWQIFIEENSSSQKEAFDLFFKLREEYDQKSQTK
jgi:hypothetical protein